MPNNLRFASKLVGDDMNCTEQPRLLHDEVNAWHALEAMKKTPTTESSHETLDQLQAKADKPLIYSDST